MYIVYCQNKPKSEHIVSEYIDTYFEVKYFINFLSVALLVYRLVDDFSMNVTYLFLCPGP